MVNLGVVFVRENGGAMYFLGCSSRIGLNHISMGRAWADAWGQVYRVNGPAVEYIDGSKSWMIHGSPVRTETGMWSADA
jgi:hypothetical protein